MAVQFRATANNSDTGTASCNKPTGTLQNDMLVAWVASYNTTAISGPTGWTKQLDVNDGNSQLSCWTKIAGASEPTSYSWGGGSGYFDSSIQSFYSDASKALQLDGTPSSLKQTTESSPSLTAAGANEALSVCWMTDGNNGSGSGVTSCSNSITVDTGTGAVGASHADGFGAGHKLITASGATGAAAWSNLGNTSTAGIGGSILIQEASAAANNLGASARATFLSSAVLVGQSRARFYSRTSLADTARSTFNTKTALQAQARDTFKTATGLKAQARDTFLTAATHTTQARSTFSTRTALATEARSTFSIRTALTQLARSTFKIASSGAKFLGATARVVFVGKASLTTETRATFATRTHFAAQARSAFSIRTVLASQARSRFLSSIAFAQHLRATFATRTALASQARATFATRFLAGVQARARFLTSFVAQVQSRAHFVTSARLSTPARSTFKVSGIIVILPFRIAFKSAKQLLNVVPKKTAASLSLALKKVVPVLSISVVGSKRMADPNTTIQVTLSATNTSGAAVTNCSAVAVTVTFPDGTTSNFSLASGVTNNGDGTYTLQYTTKGIGPHIELWNFTAADGTTTAEYRNTTPVWV